MCYRNSPFCFRQQYYAFFSPNTQKKQMNVSRPLNNNEKGHVDEKVGDDQYKAFGDFYRKMPISEPFPKIMASGLIDALQPHLPITQ